jgi:cell division protein FtsQ
MEKARPRPRSGFWPFRRPRNRRVRPVREARPSGVERMERRAKWKRAAIVLAVLALVGGGGFGGWRFATRSHHFAVRSLRFVTPAGKPQHASEAALTARAGLAVGSNLFALDLAELSRELAQEPWVQSARARRELPSTIAVDIVEREAACVVALGALYLADASGAVFKRAAPEEAAGLVVVTGIAREEYLADGDKTRARIRDALAVLAAWNARAALRPPIGELHLDRAVGVTAYTRSGVGVRLGRPQDNNGDALADRLQRFDAVWSALASTGERPRVIYLDNRARPDRVTVKLES